MSMYKSLAKKSRRSYGGNPFVRDRSLFNVKNRRYGGGIFGRRAFYNLPSNAGMPGCGTFGGAVHGDGYQYGCGDANCGCNGGCTTCDPQAQAPMQSGEHLICSSANPLDCWCCPQKMPCPMESAWYGGLGSQ